MAITYFTKFSVVVVTFNLKVLPADHRQPSFPAVNILGKAIHPESFLWAIAASKGCKHILKEIKDVKSISFTTDIWSSDDSSVSLLSLTAHWLDETFVPHSAKLNATNFRGSHTSKAIAASLKDMLDKWQIPLSKFHMILKDNASNMRKVMDNLGVHSVGCVAHTMHLVVNEGLLSQRAFSDAVACARHFKHPPLAYSRLQDIQQQMNMQPKRLQQDVKTRWNSTYYMVERLNRNEHRLLILLTMSCPQSPRQTSGPCLRK